MIEIIPGYLLIRNPESYKYFKLIDLWIIKISKVREFSFWREEEEEDDDRLYIYFPVPGKYLINKMQIFFYYISYVFS